ncbi:MAG TPA: PAS domain-containing protein, partial [Terriglobales bacterium]|nr:PAS domain-containing protein [Terriglobales bacterium]
MDRSRSAAVAAVKRRPLRRSVVAFSDDFEYREFFDDCGCFFFALDRQTRFIEVDRQGARATGYSRREILKKALSDIVPPEHR